MANDSGMSGDELSGENVRCRPVEIMHGKNSWNRISAKSIKLSGPLLNGEVEQLDM